MIGYMCAYLRYYYPEEFIAAYLNCANNSDDIVFGTELAKLKNIQILPIKFGKSRADYSVDKANHAIYKGINSIKFCNAKIAEELYELYKPGYYDNFIDLLYDINTKTSINSRQLEILTGLNFFSEFGQNAYLFDIINIYNKFAGVKQIKKDKMEELGLDEFMMKKYAEKETAKIYKGIDWMGIVHELASKVQNRPFDVIHQMKFEKDHLEYVDTVYPDVNEVYYVVTDFVQNKDASKPRLTARRICDGQEVKTRIKYSKIYKEHPFGLWSVLKIKYFDQEYKSRPDANGNWVKTDELEDILNRYDVIKE